MSDSLAQIAKHFRKDPVGYCRVVLGATLTPDQERILKLLIVPPYKVLVKSAHLVGKSWLAAACTLWFFDCFDPCAILTTAPNSEQLGNVWKELRQLRGPWPGLLPKAHVLESHPKHFAKGITARDANAFQGKHDAAVGIVFDEAVGVAPEFWEAAETMLNGDNYFFLAIFNPTDQSSYAYTAERSGNYHVVSLSALTHPNIAAELKGEPAPYPGAMRLGRLNELINQWATPLNELPIAGDIEWPPESGKWFRPGPVCEARLLGRWPTLASNSIWTDTVFDHAANLVLSDEGPVQLGCDVARFGDDDTCIIGRKGRVAIHCETHNGWSTTQTAARLRELADQYSKQYDQQKAKEIVINVDDIGQGAGVTDQAHGYNFHGINVANKAYDQNMYGLRRSELWFEIAEQAAKGEVSFVKLSNEVKEKLRQELLAPIYTIDYQGRRQVEQKKDTKKRIGRSPDLADALHLAYTSPRWHQTDKIQFKPIEKKGFHKFVD